MAPIGKPKRIIRSEPLKEPRQVPYKAPAQPVREKEKVPA